MIEEKTIVDFMQYGKKYKYLGEDFYRFKKDRIYRCYIHLPYMILMSYKGRGIKPGLSGVFNYPVNNIKNWKELEEE